MNNNQFMDTVFKSLGALKVIEQLGTQARFSPEQTQEAVEFIQVVSEHEDFVEEMRQRAMQAIRELVEVAKMAKGYQEMGVIYEQVAKDFYHLEQEGEMWFEMATEETQTNVS